MMRSLLGKASGKILHRLSILLLVLFFLGASGNTKGWYHSQWKEYEKTGRFAEAIPFFTKAIEKYPKEAWFYVYIGHSYLKLNRHAEGIPYLKKAARLAPDNTGVLRNLRGGMRSFYYSRWKKFEKSGRFAEAIPLFTRAINDFPGEPWFFVFLGHSQLKMKRHLAGIAQLEKAARLAPSDAGVRRNLRGGLIEYGSYLRKSGKLEESLAYFERAVLADPDNAWSHNLLGHTLTLVAKHARAYRSFRESVRLAGAGEMKNPKFKGNIRLGVNKGSAHFRAHGDLDKALAYRELGARVFPGNWVNLIKLMETAHAAGKPRRGRAVARNVRVGTDRRILAAALEMFEGKLVAAERTLAGISQAHNGDFGTQQKISQVYNAMVAGLDYKKRMNSPMQQKLVHYAKKAVKAYFEKHPYRQQQSFRVPLGKSFCVRQGAGEISFHYGLRSHFSYDMSHCKGNSTGMEVVAVARGKVLAVVSSEPDRAIGSPVNLSAKANYIRIAHRETVSLYVHLKQHSALVKVGDQVRAGQKIGEVGNSGISTGPHLHFNISNKDGITLPARFNNIEGVIVSGQKFNKDYVQGVMLKKSSRYQPSTN